MTPLRQTTVLGALVALAALGNPARADDGPPVADARSPGAPSAVAMTAAQPPSRDTVEWTLSAAAGPVVAALEHPWQGAWPPSFGAKSAAWQVELERLSPDKPLLLGAALEGTHDQTGGQQLLGAHVFAGTVSRHQHGSLEATVGVGLEAAQTVQADLTYHLGLYAQGALVAAVPVSPSLEVFLRLGVHLTATHDEDWFAASTIGVRYRLP